LIAFKLPVTVAARRVDLERRFDLLITNKNTSV
jgi:hypothetical protein